MTAMIAGHHFRRAPWSMLGLGLFCGLFIYLVIQSRLDGSQFRPVFSSRMLMMNQHPGINTDITGSSGEVGGSISNAMVISAIDNMVQQMSGSSSSSGDIDTRVQLLSQELAKQIANYVVQRIGQPAGSSTFSPLSSPMSGNGATSTCLPCWRYQNVTDLPVIYVVTPTYRRPEQIPELTRLAQTLMNVPAIHWIVVEDSNSTSPAVSALINRYGLPSTHLNAQMPAKYAKSKLKPRGVANRNAALDWVRSHCTSGVVYFADDDNSYDIRLFEEMRYTKKVSMWPVGLVTKVGLSSPVVNDKGVVVDFFDGWMANRKFPVDMAGFAVSVSLILEKANADMPYVPGHEEDGFLKKLDITPADIEPKADGCTKVMVWHTQTKGNQPANRTVAGSQRYKNTNIARLQELLV